MDSKPNSACKQSDFTAAARTIAPLWATNGRRHSAFLALAGGLLRSGWNVDRVEALVAALADATRDEEAPSRIADVRSTAKRIQERRPANGWRRLAALLPGQWGAVSAIKRALGIACPLAEFAETKRLPVAFLASLGIKDREGGGIEIPYRDLTGKVVATRTRDNLTSRPVWPKGQAAIIYGEDRLQDAVAAGCVVLVEGESDCWTLWHYGIPTLGIPGNECTKVLQVGHVAQLKKIYVVQEHGESGEVFVEGVRHRLAALEWPGELRRISLGEHKDASALHIADPKRFKERWQAALEQAAPLELPSAASATISMPAESPWPSPLAPEAYHGLAGAIVRVLEPASEADPVALLSQILAGFGNLIGRSAHCLVEADRHYGNEFFCLTGRTSKARKGTSWSRVNALLNAAETEWSRERVQTGLSSGEGLIWSCRDPILKQERVKERGEPVRYETVEADPGISDKRLLIVEPEFASVLKQTERMGNTLSAILRQAWESGDLRSLTKNSPARATGAHVSMIGHITVEELRRYLTTTEMANGFGNRIAWICVRRSKELPEGGRVDEAVLAGLQARLTQALEFARNAGTMARDDEARELWRAVYGQLSGDRPGLSGAMMGRAEAHVLRWSLLYALLDSSPVIAADHLLAALALWHYSEQSVRHIFGDALGDGLADELLRLLRAAPDGMSRWETYNALGRHQSSERTGRALALLAQHGLVRVEKKATGGRPEERWFAERR